MSRALAISLGALLAVALGVSLALRPPVVEVPPRGFELADVTLVEPGVGRRPHVTLGGAARIERIAPAVPAGGPERFVLPGLIDLHVHHPPAFAPGERELFALLFLAHGVTGVRDTGSFVGSLAPHAERIERGERPGPRTFRCGRVIEERPTSWPGALGVAGREEARRAVAGQVESGVDCIKTYNNLTPVVLREIREEAAARGLPLVAHVPWGLSLRELPGAEVQHLMGLTEDWGEVLPRHETSYVEASRGLDVRHTPTLVAFARSARLADLPGLLGDPVARLVPRHYREQLWNPARNPRVTTLSPQAGAQEPERLAVMTRVLGALHRAGVPILAGSDTPNAFVVPGASLQEELALLAAAGLGPEGAWAAASRRAGRALGVPELGRLVEGAPADLLVFRRDPTADLAALASLELVVADGRVYPRRVLQAALERHLAWSDRGLPRWVGELEARLAVALMGGRAI